MQTIGTASTSKNPTVLAVLKNEEHVKQILLDAKRLRQSEDPTTRDQIYINRHLTKAEAAAAYELRCQKRQLRHRRITETAQVSHTEDQLRHGEYPNLTLPYDTDTVGATDQPDHP
jgi:hypothetical protein